jgi:diaminopimelate decarboxylase
MTGVPARVAAAVRALPSPACAYVYDREVLHANASRLRAALPSGALLCYAIKANSHPAVVAALAQHLDGLEIASGGELAVARAALDRPHAGLILFGGPAKTDAELAAAMDAGAIIHVESLHELRRLGWLAGRAGGGAGGGAGGRAPVEIALRVNRADGTARDARLDTPDDTPGHVPAGTHRMTGVPTPFGLDEGALPEAVALASSSPGLRLVGFHLHAVSNNLDAPGHARFVVGAVEWSVAAAARLGIDLTYVNVGGGLGVDYTGGTPFDTDAFAAGLVNAADPLPPRARLVFEPGRLLAASAGWYAAEVLDVKRTHGRWFAVLRGGTHHFRLPAAWGYSHPFTVLRVSAWPYPFRRPQVRAERVDVVGELCTPRDVLARDVPVDELRAGDIVVFGQTGAYGWDISHHDFLRHEHPRTIIL